MGKFIRIQFSTTREILLDATKIYKISIENISTTADAPRWSIYIFYGNDCEHETYDDSEDAFDLYEEIFEKLNNIFKE